LSDINATRNVERFLKNTQISNFMKIRPVRSRVVPCGRKDAQTDIVAFRNSANEPENLHN